MCYVIKIDFMLALTAVNFQHRPIDRRFSFNGNYKLLRVKHQQVQLAFLLKFPKLADPLAKGFGHNSKNTTYHHYQRNFTVDNF